MFVEGQRVFALLCEDGVVGVGEVERGLVVGVCGGCCGVVFRVAVGVVFGVVFRGRYLWNTKPFAPSKHIHRLQRVHHSHLTQQPFADVADGGCAQCGVRLEEGVCVGEEGERWLGGVAPVQEVLQLLVGCIGGVQVAVLWGHRHRVLEPRARLQCALVHKTQEFVVAVALVRHQHDVDEEHGPPHPFERRHQLGHHFAYTV